MDGNKIKNTEMGRPRAEDPKMIFNKVRLKMSTIINIEEVAEKLGISQSLLVQTILENEMEKYKNLLKIE